MEWRRSRERSMSKTPLFYCISICCFSVCALVSTVGTRTVALDIKNPSDRKADRYSQDELCSNTERRNDNEDIIISRSKSGVSLSLGRRYLSGPGSSPPRCTSKCGRCTPCKPVHVPVPPGTPVTTEYYPEAWRCKCGNKLYMP